MTAYELLKLSIVDQLRLMYEEYRLSTSPPERKEEYKREVLGLDRDQFMASCLWYEKNGVITTEEVRKISVLRETRNQFAHQLPHLLFNSDDDFSAANIKTVRDLLGKLDRWFVRTWEIPTIDELDGKKIPDNEIMSSRMAVLELILNVDAKKQHSKQSDD